MEVSFVSLLNCNQFGWSVEEEDPIPYPPHPHSELWRVLYSCFPSSQWAVKSSAFLLSFLMVSCEEFYILACSLFTLGKCGKILYYSASVVFSSAVRGGVQYTAPLAIQICGCLHSTMGHGHFSLQTPIPECMHTGQQLSVAHTTMLDCRESPLTPHPSSLPTNRFLFA